jgi:hypothetical protein
LKYIHGSLIKKSYKNKSEEGDMGKKIEPLNIEFNMTNIPWLRKITAILVATEEDNGWRVEREEPQEGEEPGFGKTQRKAAIAWLSRNYGSEQK